MIRIFADSTCDLSAELISRYGISILPLHVVLGEEEYLDAKNITPDEIYRWSDENNQAPKTSAVSMETAMDAFSAALEAGDEIICFAISSQMSTTANVMRLAAQELDAQERVSVVDSMNLSTGSGLLVIEAAILAGKGMERAEIVAHVESLRDKVRASFVVDTLSFLHRGGRCSGLAAMAGAALKLHPRIAVVDGAMHPQKKYRGSIDRAVMAYVRDMEEELRCARPERVFITHSGCSEALIAEVRTYLEQLGRFDEIHVTRAGGVISCHCGPGTLGVLFIAP